MDGQFRIRIPLRLAESALTDKNTVIVGVGTHWEIWDPAKWHDYNRRHQAEFEAMAESVLGRAASVSEVGESVSESGGGSLLKNPK